MKGSVSLKQPSYYKLSSFIKSQNLLICQVQGAVFDLPEDIAKELLEKEVPEGNSLSMITKVLILTCSQ